MIKNLRQKLADYQPRRFTTDRPQASVLVALTDEADPTVILTQRSSRLSTHQGEVAFPGGKHDLTDADLVTTALREAHEEVAIHPNEVEIIGSLGQLMSKHQLQVTPWVGIVRPDIDLKANPGELDAVFRVPLSFFMEDRRLRTDEIHFRGKTTYVPAWQYDGFIIWGLTAYLMVELLNVGLDAGIPMKPRPEHLQQ